MKNLFSSLSIGAQSTIAAISVLLILMLLAISLSGQNYTSFHKFPDGKEGFLLLQGTVKDSSEKRLRDNVTVEIINNNTKDKSTVYTKNGSFNTALFLNYEYTITFSCPGYGSKSILVNTEVHMDWKNYFFQFDVIMLRKIPKAQVAEVYFESKDNQFSYKLN